MLTYLDTLPAPLASVLVLSPCSTLLPCSQSLDDLLLSRHRCLPFPTPRLPFLPCIYLATGLYPPWYFASLGEKWTHPCQGPTLGHSWGWSSPCHHRCHLLSWSENLHHLPRFLLIPLQVLSPCSSRFQMECTSGRALERRRGDSPELQYNTKMASLNTKTFSVVMLEHCTRDLC